ncbi:MAG TPA: hypothetical protein VH583_04695 [Vicinamibacterales bacterium]|jgi:hypothetical protein
MIRLSVALYAWLGALLFVFAGTPAYAQYQPRPTGETALGEDFHIEGGLNFWGPTSDMTVASSGSGALAGIPGTSINAKTDLGFVDQRLTEFNVTFRPAPAHKIRFQYLPIDFEASSTLRRTIDFNGQRYDVGLPVNSSLEWKTYRFGYEWDFFRSNSGFAGFIAEAKFTDVTVDLASPVVNEFTHAKAPIPAIGGVGRYYFIPMVAITGELTLFKLPTVLNNYSGHYTDLNIYGTVNFVKNFGVQGGYRSVDVGFLAKQDTGAFTLKGIYFGLIARY